KSVARSPKRTTSRWRQAQRRSAGCRSPSRCAQSAPHAAAAKAVERLAQQTGRPWHEVVCERVQALALQAGEEWTIVLWQPASQGYQARRWMARRDHIKEIHAAAVRAFPTIVMWMPCQEPAVA
ncbi:MAG: hypothetical protein J2P48_18020, partial [Alphaproteobacteria bacterium]|nr:hypothetical protein [Alphaproteobacteria bacterium]